MKAKIWGLGLSRTGTTTLGKVLNEAGYNWIHYPNERQMDDLNNDGAGDIPVLLDYKRLDMKFPNSKFIYTVRDKDEWLQSMKKYIMRKHSWGQAFIGKRQVEIREGVYGNRFFDWESYSKAYDRWDNEFREYFKYRKDDFLVLDILGGDSPQKLKEFLGTNKKFPDEFPHYNKLIGNESYQIK